ncbi:RNA polymerase II-associated protein 3-like [Argiope bruennichi]|uniref:RNA polymerase II-associated protein 3-like n=1 Tax=Argiope bruennichi TaxID=94029 RepID=UPI0024959A7A|nr:RNA polymerase II-associated protein 3-like [Argiope bruennichi]
MNLENTINVQNQIRENSEDLQNFLKDMDIWETDMKRREEERKLLQVSDEQVIPPIRNSLSRSKKKSRRLKVKKEDDAKEERISSYNYKAWEHYDADLELKKLDEEKKESSDSESTDSEEQLTIQKNKQLAIIKKDKGNELFKAGNYDSAINTYTVGMQLDPENAILPANRAMAFLRKDQFQAAEDDCTLCLSLDPSYVKAYLRRGTARKALEKFDLARNDFLKALELQPDSKHALQELEKLNKEVAIKAENDKTNGTVKVSDNSVQDEMKSSGLFADAKAVSTLNSDAGFHEESFTKLEVSNYSHDEFKEGLKIENKSLLNTVEQNHNEKSSSIKVSKTVKPHDSSHSKHVEGNGVYSNELENIIAKLEQKLPPVPTASYQFLTDWKKLSKYPELKYQYLKQFPPEKFSKLFKHYMEPEIFPEILSTLSSSFIDNGDDIVPYMMHLASVGRFNTMLMFLTDPEKKDLRKLLSYAEMSGYLPEEVEALLKLYKI